MRALIFVNMGSCGSSSDSLPVDSLPTISDSGGGTNKNKTATNLNTMSAHPYKFWIYDVPQAGAKCTVPNNINLLKMPNNTNLLKNVHWYNQWFGPKARMKGATSNNIIIPQAEKYLQVPTIQERKCIDLMEGATSNNIIIPQAERYLQVPTIQERKCIDVRCYYSLEFTSTLLSDNDVRFSSRFSKEYSEQLMLKFFNSDEELPEDQQEQIWNQKLDEVTRNYIIMCTHKNKSNQKFYLPGIICAELCYTMPLIIPSGLQSMDPHTSVLSSREKTYSTN